MENGLPLKTPRILPALDPAFRPAILASRAFQAEAKNLGAGQDVGLALEQADGSVCHFSTTVFRESHPRSRANFVYFERILKFLLWSRGGCRIYLAGSPALAEQLQHHYRESPTGKFDAEMIGGRIYDHTLEVISAVSLPPERTRSAALGRHRDGCRIGFDLGGSDRKVAAVQNGEVLFSEETPWDPVTQSDPQYHFNGIMESLQRAAAHLPRVEAIGGSAAGAYVNNQVKVASLFRAVPPELFERRVKNLFLEIQQAWGNVPLEIVNDGEVTALAGSMALGKNGVLGIAMGTSMAAGYVTMDGNITSWLNELAFAPVDYNPGAAVDEWSGDCGCGALYFSQQCVARLMPPGGIQFAKGMPLPEQLVYVQELMRAGDDRASRIYKTIGTYLGYAVAHYASFYDFRYVLVLGRVTSGEGGDLIVRGAREVLESEFPDPMTQIQFHIPSEKEKRHGQAVAAASLPSLRI